MGVIIGSARHDENGRYANGKAGDQDGTEVSTQNFYVHSKGWVVIRPKRSDVAEKIALCMKWACDNNHIGYDQNQRDTLYNKAKIYDFDVRGVTTDVETDCSALVRVCCNYAGVSVGDFYTGNAVDVLDGTGHFDIMNFSNEASLKRGDILCTRTKGHIVVCLNDGSPAVNIYTPNTWYHDQKGWWYAVSSTEYARNEFRIINHHKYFFESDGYAVKGYQEIDGKSYFFETSGDLECAMMYTDINGCLYVKEF